MTNKEILRANMLDILFENRNKAYGAYALRKNYNHRLQWAISISLGLVLLLLLINYIDTSTSSSGPEQRRDAVELSIIEIPEPEKPEPEKKPEQKPVEQQVKSTDNIVITKDDLDVPPLDNIEDAKVSNQTVAGTPPTGIVDTTTTTPSDGKGDKPAAPDKEFIPVSSDPKFPGGKEAFAEFLKNNLITPEEIELGEKRTVQIRFMVDVDGSISKAEVVVSGGKSFDKEVIRVLRKMPKWIPAMQNGIKVATYFTQPVIFMGIE